MQSMSNLDYFYLEKELSCLEGGRFNKAYELEEGVLRLKLHKEGEKNFIINKGVRAHFTKYLQETGEPKGFVQELRRLLDNARIIHAKQLNFDRVLEFKFQKAETFYLIIELFGREGNLLLCDSNKKILRAYHKEEYSVRKLKANEPYSTPPIRKKHPSEMESLEELKGNVIAALSEAVNLPPFYLEEVCKRAGIRKWSSIASLSGEEKESLVKKVKGIVSEEVNPVVYYEKGIPIAFSPFPLEKMEEFEEKGFESFSEALDEYYQNAVETLQVKHSQTGGLRKSLETQLETVRGFESEAEENKKLGDFIYANYQFFEEAGKLYEQGKKLKKSDAEMLKAMERLREKHGLRAKLSTRNNLLVIGEGK